VSQLVIDANTVIDWFVVTIEGEAYSRHLEPVISAGDVQLVVPLHFDVEVVAHLVKKHRQDKRKFTKAWLDSSLNIMDLLPFEITALGVNFKLMGDLAKTFNLSVYDTPYFQLARVMGLPLATRDRGLIAACKQWHVERWQP
jgi:predicted nucleic acid-binding protein